MGFAWSTPPGRRRVFVSTMLCCVALQAAWLGAADQWIEVKSQNFVIVSNAGERSARKLAWQLEQIRSATIALWSFAKPTLDKPLVVLAARDEQTMRSLAPQYWEVRGGVRPASVWGTGPDAHYLAIRTDIEVDTQAPVNPYLMAYHAYTGLVLSESLDRDLPEWFLHGFTEFLSNTIVREDHILLGTPLSWHLERLREQPVMPLAKLLAVTRTAPEMTNADRRQSFDAQTWAFMHFLIFSDPSQPFVKVDRFTRLIADGRSADAAFTEAIGPVAAIESQFRLYIQKRIFLSVKYKIDAAVDREKFPVRVVPPAESWADRALFHTVMRRPEEARAAILEARKLDADIAGAYVADGLLFDAEAKRDEAKAAYARAAELNTTNAYVYYRLAGLTWQPAASPDVMAEIEKYLTKAVAANNRYADAYAWLGEIRVAHGNAAGLGFVQRAIALEPRDASHRLRAARVLLMQGKPDDAKAAVESASSLVDSDRDRQMAQELLDDIARFRSRRPASSPAAATASSAATTATAAKPSATPPESTGACQRGDNDACAALLPIAISTCAQKNGSACGMAGFLYEHGRGVAVDKTKSAEFYRQACAASDRLGCVAFALMQAYGTGVEKDVAQAEATLTQLCADSVDESCVQLAALLAGRGGAANLGRARELLTKSCNSKSARACAMLESLPKGKE